MATDKTVVIACGARCTWWDDKSKAGSKPSGLPCCPHCGGVLFQCEMENWWADAHRYEEDGHPDYVPFLRWLQGKCYENHVVARTVYMAELDVT